MRYKSLSAVSAIRYRGLCDGLTWWNLRHEAEAAVEGIDQAGQMLVMQTINKLLIDGSLKFLFMFLPTTFLTFFACYLAGEYLISHGVRNALFAPALLSFLFLTHLSKRIFGPILIRIEELHKDKGDEK